MKFLKDILSNSEGVLSSIRVVMIFSYVFAVFLPLSIWAIASLTSNPIKMADFPSNLAWFMGTIVTVATSGKIVQLLEEKKPNP
jgi:hypothetical protein